jgi:transcription termination/antitermination protein NusG
MTIHEQNPLGAASSPAVWPPSDPSTTCWYALSTKHRHERMVEDQLKEKGVDTFLPRVRRWSRWKDRRMAIDWPLFPGYCFARFDPDERLRIVSCRGVVRIVSCAGVLVPVDETELNSIRILLDTSMRYDPCPFLKEGQMVAVRSGPLCGVVGRLLRKDLHHVSVVLSVDLIGQALRVEVSAADVEAAD